MSANSQSIAARAREISRDGTYQNAEAKLPYWARSTNPIVRRHLGLYWRTVPPETRPFVVIYATWCAILGLGMLFPALLSLTMISFLAAIMIVPLAMLLYGHVLLTVSIQTADAMQQEMRNNTFNLLRTTPMSLQQIFLGKVAAALWRRMDDIVMIGQVVLAFSPPILFTVYTSLWSADFSMTAIQTPIATLVGTLVVFYRVVAEPVMIGAIAVFAGIVVSGRTRAITSAVVLGAFYFIILNLMSRLPTVRGFEGVDGTVYPPNISLIVLIDFVLPVVLPLVITYGLLTLSARIVQLDRV